MWSRAMLTWYVKNYTYTNWAFVRMKMQGCFRKPRKLYCLQSINFRDHSGYGLSQWVLSPNPEISLNSNHAVEDKLKFALNRVLCGTQWNRSMFNHAVSAIVEIRWYHVNNSYLVLHMKRTTVLKALRMNAFANTFLSRAKYLINTGGVNKS